MSLITIKESHIASDLSVLKSRLEAEGIKCYLKNEHITQIMNYMPTFVVELQVSNADLSKAKEIMLEIREV
jgi:transcription initiation factor TFIIIB Brf1 subunit/transcription initiation factor TFIIB